MKKIKTNNKTRQKLANPTKNSWIGRLCLAKVVFVAAQEWWSGCRGCWLVVGWRLFGQHVCGISWHTITNNFCCNATMNWKRNQRKRPNNTTNNNNTSNCNNNNKNIQTNWTQPTNRIRVVLFGFDVDLV